MCLTICYKRGIVYDNDRLTVCSECSYFNQPNGEHTCDDCINNRNGICKLTLVSLPKKRWCCHWGVDNNLGYVDGGLRHIDGIVLVSEEEFNEAMQDYKYKKEKIAISEFMDLYDDDALNLPELLAEYKETEEIPQYEDRYKLLTEDEAREGKYVPIVVGKELIRLHGSIGGLVRFFEEIYGGPDDISVDWKGRYIIRPGRFATPGIYGVAAADWQNEIDSEDLIESIHDIFN